MVRCLRGGEDKSGCPRTRTYCSSKARVNPVVLGRRRLLVELDLEDETPDPGQEGQQGKEEVRPSGTSLEGKPLGVDEATEDEVHADSEQSDDEGGERSGADREVEREEGRSVGLQKRVTRCVRPVVETRSGLEERTPWSDE